MKTLISALLAISLSVFGQAKETFTLETLESLLNNDNPYVYKAVGRLHIEEAKVKTAKGEFDTRVSSEYEKKRYPLSEGDFFDSTITKPTESGIELIAGYRKAQGIQEYNNIKTSPEGELRIGAKIPLSEVLMGTNKRRYNLESRRIAAKRAGHTSELNLLELKVASQKAYHEATFAKSVFLLESELLEKAQKRKNMIERRVAEGDLSEFELAEAEAQLEGRRQRTNLSKNSYRSALSEISKYAGLTGEEFFERFKLPEMTEETPATPILAKLEKQAFSNRADLKALRESERMLENEKTFNSLNGYPKTELFAYAVNDRSYGEGVKAGIKFSLPLERRGYKGKNLEIQKEQMLLRGNEIALKRDISAKLESLISTSLAAKENLKLSKNIVSLSEKLERAEERRYKEGMGNLFLLNQREIATLEAKKKQLSYQLDAILAELDISKETGGAFRD